MAVDYRDFVVGMPRIENIERVVENSRRTIVVLTPAWLDSEWNAFEALLLRTMDPAARQRRLLPVLLKPCELPELIGALEKVDLTVERHWERQIQRLARDIEDVLPVSPPWKEGGVRDFTQWRRWLRRYRRELRRGTVAACAVWLVGSLALQLPPFQPRQVWMSLGLRAPSATKLVRAGDVLLAGGTNEERGCELLERGLWRGVNSGATWQPIHASALCFERPGQGEVLADIVDLAVAEAQPERIYAATSDVGLLRSDDAGQTWRRIDSTGLESSQLGRVAVDPHDAERVFVALAFNPAWPEGLYRSTDGGQHWQRLDRRGPDAPACERGMALTRTLSVGALLVTPERVVIGTGDPCKPTDTYLPSGLYASTDGGDCWERIDDGEGHYQYVTAIDLPAVPGRPLLVLTKDWWEDGLSRLWRLDVASPSPERRLLWAYAHGVRAVIAGDGDNPGWYAATDLGEVLHGSPDAPDRVERLPRITCCMLACDVALAPDVGEGPPVLLAGGRVFRLTDGPWWHEVWPCTKRLPLAIPPIPGVWLWRAIPACPPCCAVSWMGKACPILPTDGCSGNCVPRHCSASPRLMPNRGSSALTRGNSDCRTLTDRTSDAQQRFKRVDTGQVYGGQKDDVDEADQYESWHLPRS